MVSLFQKIDFDAQGILSESPGKSQSAFYSASLAMLVLQVAGNVE